MKAVVILPTYNERENIITLLEALHQVTSAIGGYQFQFLVVDDTSPDGTGVLVNKYKATHPRVHLLSGKKEGLGKALLRGMTYAVKELGADIIVQMDADLSHDPQSLPAFFKKLNGGAEFVVGSRYIMGGSIPGNWGIHRKIFSVVGNAIVRFGLGYLSVHDWTGGYRAYHKKFYERAKDKVARYSGYVFQIAFLHNAVKVGTRIAEVPINFTDRRFGRSKIAPPQYIRNVLVYVAGERIKQLWQGPFSKFAVVGTIGFIINTAVLELLVFLKFHPVIGSAVGAELAIISNFTLNNSWTFRDRRIRGWRLIPKFLQFNTTSVGAIIIQSGTVAVGTLLFGVYLYRWFYILGVGLGLIWNYAMYSRVIWKK